MPTLLMEFPVVPRNGTQQTPWRDVPEQFDSLRLEGQADASVLSDERNAITFVVQVSPAGASGPIAEIQREEWTGGTFIPKGGTDPIPRPIHVEFGPFAPHVGKQVRLQATFHRSMRVGATLTGLP